MKQAWRANFGLLALLPVLLLCECATGNSAEDGEELDSGTVRQTDDATTPADSASGAESSLAQGDSSFHIDSGEMTADSASPADSEVPPADTGEGDTGAAADSAARADSGASDSGTVTEDGGRDGASESSADSSTEDAPDSHAEAGADSATESGVVDSAVVDSAVVDSGSTAADTSTPVTCAPGSLTGFTATNVQALNDIGACTNGQISAIVTDCLDPNSTQTTCNNLSNADENCVTDCPILTPYSSTNVTIGMPPPPPMGPWGPFIQVFNPGESDFFNLGACVSLADTSQTGKACGNALTQEFECEYYVCASNCSIPATGDATAAENAYNDCTTAADGCPASGNGPCTGVCGSFVNTVDNDCTNELTGPAAFCLDGSLASTTSSTADPSLKDLIEQQCSN